jgi:lipoyl(octanoyl) transferase
MTLGERRGARRPEEVMVVVHRAGPAGREFLVLERTPERQGYWNLVAGGLEPGETPAAAAARELSEEVGLAREPLLDLGLRLRYSLAGEPAGVRARFPPEVEEVVLHAFAVAAPAGWEPVLDEEHDAYRWLPADEAARTLAYPEPREAVRAAARLLERP